MSQLTHSAGNLSAAERRRLRWRRFVERQTLIRHPVSPTRQRFGWVIFLLLVVSLLWYATTTRDEAIRQRAVAFLEATTSGEIQVERARFKMFEGITLYGVRVAVPYNKDLDPQATDAAAREIFSASSLQLIHDPWRLLLGDLQVEKILAVEPRIVLAHNVDTGLRNWQLLGSSSQPSGHESESRDRPPIAIRSAKAEVISIHADGRRDSRAVELDADVRPHSRIRSALAIEVRRYTEPAERTTVVFDPRERTVTNTPFVDFKTVRLQLPKPVQDFFDRINLQGDAKISRMVYATPSPEERETTIEVRRVRCAFPLALLGELKNTTTSQPTTTTSAPTSDQSSTKSAVPTDSRVANPAEDMAIVVSQVQGQFELRKNRLNLDLEGVVNNAKFQLTGSLDNIDASPEIIGLNLKLRGFGVTAPQGDFRRYLEEQPRIPREIKSFLGDFDPQGPFDLDLMLTRPADGSAGLRITGTLEPKGARASCRWFPYLVENLQGKVRFDPPGVFLDNIRGRHGTANIQIEGKVDRTLWYAATDVNIKATDVPLDDALYASLPERHQKLWRKFGPQGMANIAVTITRPAAERTAPQPAWQTSVSGQLTNAKLCFQDYPYPLERVQGSIDIQANRTTFEKLKGYHGETAVLLEGFVEMLPNGGPTMELRIETQDLLLDETFVRVLPLEAREVFTQFQPAGRIDLLGKVSLSDEPRGLEYDLWAKLHDGTLCYRAFPYRLQEVSADFGIRPDKITIAHLTGRHGTALVTAEGNVLRTPQGFVTDLDIACSNLTLDQDFHATLPPSLREIWQLIDPAGVVSLKTRLHYAMENGVAKQRHQTDLETSGASLAFAGLPLRLSDVAAQVRMNDRHIEFRSLQARAGTGQVSLRGEIDLTPAGQHGTLSLETKGLTFDDELVTALPPALRKPLETIKPSGRFDLKLPRLRFDLDDAGRGEWDFEGELRLDDGSGRLGFEVRKLNGMITGRGTVSADGTVGLETRLNLDSAILGGWHLDHFTGRLAADPRTKRVTLEDVTAGAYGGEAVGLAEIDFGPRETTYQLSVSARDIQLDRYVAVHAPPISREPNPQDNPPRGAVYGNLALRGSSSPTSFREGTGEVFVREAQICRLPIMLTIFQVLNLTPDENAFHDGWAKFTLTNDDLTFQRIDLQGSALSFVGGGKMDLRTRLLDIILLAGSPVRLRVPILTELLEGAARDLMEVRVTGTPEKPRIVPQSIENLAEVLKTLFPETPPRIP